MVFKTVISFICGLYRFYPVLPMGKTDCFTQFYPTGFTHWVKLPCQPWLQACRHHLQDQLNQDSGLPIWHHSRNHPTRTLRSADIKLLLVVPRMSLTLSAKAFCVSAPSIWNSLSYNCRFAELLSTFKRLLKTELFAIAYSEREHSA